jgi:hypothetical protein
VKSTLIHLRLGHIASECIATRSLAPAVSTRFGSRDAASAGKIITESNPAHTSAAAVVGEMRPVCYSPYASSRCSHTSLTVGNDGTACRSISSGTAPAIAIVAECNSS